MINKKLYKNLKLNTYSNTNPKINLQTLHRKSTIFTFISLVFVLVLLSSIVYTTTFNGTTHFASAYAVDKIVHDEQGLRDAINDEALNAAPVQYVIALVADIELTDSTLTIPATANVVLTSDSGVFMKLIGPNDVDTLTVAGGGVLVLDGLIVTHVSGDLGRGVTVDTNGTLELHSGEISGNLYLATYNGGGVYVSGGGSFSMFDDARIYGNTAGYGGGVYVSGGGSFSMVDDAQIYGNTARFGGGVYVSEGSFSMMGSARVDGNTADYRGGGVYVSGGGYFSMMDDTRVDSNTANYNGGGGVYVSEGSFSMLGSARIDGNTVSSLGGGVYVSSRGYFSMMDDTRVDGNTAVSGGGVYVSEGSFSMLGSARVDGNVASSFGGGVYNLGVFDMLGGAISGNTLSGTSNNNRGGGVCNAGPRAIFNMAGGIIGGNTSSSEGNSAYRGAGVYNDRGMVTISGDAAILGNNAVYGGGGVYNDAGKVNMGNTLSAEVVRISGNTANYGGGVYNTGNGASFSMVGQAVISDNFVRTDGGGVYNSAVFNLLDGEISANSAGTGGGGICTYGEFYMSGGKISNNSARSGSGVLNYRTFNMNGGEISNNTSTGYAGGVHNNGSLSSGSTIFEMSGNALISNNSAVLGGGIYNAYNATVNMSERASISGNVAVNTDKSDGRGGGVYNFDRATLNMLDNTVIADNFAVFGGGICNNANSTANMSGNAALLDNTAHLYGGGMYNWNPYSEAEPSVFSLSDNAVILGNSAAYYGGGIQNTNNGLLILSGDVVIANNSAIFGGGIYTMCALSNAVTINGCTIANNSAISGSGGGIYTNSELIVTEVVIANNTADVNGGGMYVASSGFVDLQAGIVYGNAAGNNGGGIWVTNTDDIGSLGKLYIERGTIFRDNTACVLVSLTSLSAYEEGIYRNQIQIDDGLWSNGALYGINNYDISFMTRCVIVYDPGAQGTWQADAETYVDLEFGSSTPVFGTASGVDYTIDRVSGWSFAGWLPAWSAVVSGNVTYVAQWIKNVEPIFYTVTYNGNGFTGGTVPMGGSYPAGYLMPVATQGSMIREGYVFQGWAYTPDAKTPDFTTGSTTYLTLTKDVTLYAIWLKEDPPSLMYTVTYLPGDYGTFETVSFVCALGDLTPKAPVAIGQPSWHFIGWTPKPTPTVEGDATYVAQWEPEATPTPSPSPTAAPSSSPSPTPTRPPSSSLSPSPTAAPSSSPSPTPTPTPTLSPSPSPTASPSSVRTVDGVPVWALVNLLLSVVGVILAAILTIGVLLQRNQKQKKQQAQEQKKDAKGQYVAKQKQKGDEDYTNGAEEKKQKLHRLFWFLLSVIMGIMGIIVFILTEDVTRPMALVDRWTILNVIIFVIELIAIVLTFKHKNNKDQTVAYTVHYYLHGTKNPVATSKTVAFGTIGFSVTEYAPNIVGYTVAGDGVMSLVLDADAAKNMIVFYYTLSTKEDKNEQQNRSGN